LLGYLLNWGLFGMLSIQVYVYHIAFPNEKIRLKCLVFGIYFIEAIQTIIITHDAWKAYASGYGRLEALGNLQLEWLAVPFLSGIVSCMVQITYAHRLFVLSGSKLLAIGVSLISVMQGSAAVAQGVQAFFIGNLADLATEAFTSCAIWLAGSAVCDIIIAIGMTFLLLKRNTQYPTTNTIITKLVHLVVETGLLTAVATSVDLVLFLAFPHQSYYACIALTLAKLYSNSLLAIFNSRTQTLAGR
ncbi:hypothetical protein K435DRAFT_592978, partial [Dendrothele bispora CBS 962.96]